MREYEDCVKRGKIKPFSRGKTLAPREIDAALADFTRAQMTYKDGDYKWATIQVYYSLFHSSRALLYLKKLAGTQSFLPYCRRQEIVC